MTISIINKTEIISTTNSNNEGGVQKYPEKKEEYFREKFLELSVNELRAMVQTGIVLRKE